MSATLAVSVIGVDDVLCVLRSPMGRRLKMTGSLAQSKPSAIEGDEAMTANQAMVNNAWAYAKHSIASLNAEEPDDEKNQAAQAAVHEQIAKEISGFVDRLNGEVLADRWCSGCFAKTTHGAITLRRRLPTYLCTACGSPTRVCPAPRCRNMAVRGPGSVKLPKYCAEHRHELPSFERAKDTIASPDRYEEILEFDKPNLARHTRLVTFGLLGGAVLGPVAYAAAPALGGLIGVKVGGLYGAAASSWGLAALGGGAVGSGGIALGVAGGTAVITAVGASLGGAFGASVINAYVSDDKSFGIELFRDGPGTPVLIARGFLTQNAQDWRAAVQMAEVRYPDSPIYLVRWGSKELQGIARYAAGGVGFGGGGAVAGAAGAMANKAAAALVGPVGWAMAGVGLMKNPWHAAAVRADKTGAALAGILARTEVDEVILIGHSLGGRAMITAAETLGTTDDGPAVGAVHLVGAARGRNGDWRQLSSSVHGTVHNYYSSNDKVLKILFKTAMAGSTAVGAAGFGSSYPNILDYDVTADVAGHSDYFDGVDLV
ncbi:DUF726 domain-containing protein [Gordonia iterans]